MKTSPVVALRQCRVRTRYHALGLTLVACGVLTHSGMQRAFVASLFLAGAIFYAFGTLVFKRLVLSRQLQVKGGTGEHCRKSSAPLGLRQTALATSTSEAFICTKIWLGEVAALFASYLLLPLNAAYAHGYGSYMPLRVLVLPAGLGLLLYQYIYYRRRQTLSTTTPVPKADWNSAAFAIIATVAVLLTLVATMYAENIGALGIDTHQHINWTLAVLDRGYVPLVAGHTNLLEEYTHGFHLLAALWVAAGGGTEAFIGPLIKIMPFLQTILPCAAFLEIMLAARGRGLGEKRMLTLLGALLLIAYASIMTRMPYPNDSLNGTARFSSSACLFFPLLLCMLARVQRRAELFGVGLASIPAVSALVLVFNPSLPVHIISLIVPLMLGVSSGNFRLVLQGVLSRGTLKTSLLSIAVATVIVAQDPWCLGRFASKPGVVEILNKVDIHTLSQATAQGLVTPGSRTLVSQTAYCLLDGNLPTRFATAFTTALAQWWTLPLANWLPDASPFALGQNTVYILMLKLLLNGALICQFSRGKRRGMSLALSLTSAVAVGYFLHDVAVGVLRLKSGAADHFDAWLLGEYVYWGKEHLGFVLLWLPLASLFIAAMPRGPLVRLARFTHRPGRTVYMFLALLTATLLLIGRDPGQAQEQLAKVQFADATTPADLDALRTIEAQLMPDDIVLVPAVHAALNGENWIVPETSDRALLAYARGPFIFNVRLGKGLEFSWRDLSESVCQESIDRVRRFFKRRHITAVYVRAKTSDAAAFIDEPIVCGHSLQQLGAAFPPTVTRRQQALYRLK